MDDEIGQSYVNEELQEWMYRLENHPARIALNLWNEWQRVNQIMQRNQQDLLDLVDAPSIDRTLAVAIMTSSLPDSDKGRNFHTEAYRLLHNYLASAKTLVDHSRRLVKGYGEESDFFSEYQSRVERVAKVPVTKFVHELRNVVLHSRLPGLVNGFKSNREDDNLSHELLFDRKSLIEAARWTNPARQYVQGQPRHFPVRQPMLEYGVEVANLSGWLSDQFEGLHGQDLADYDSLLDAYLAAYAQPLPDEMKRAPRQSPGNPKPPPAL